MAGPDHAHPLIRSVSIPVWIGEPARSLCGSLVWTGNRLAPNVGKVVPPIFGALDGFRAAVDVLVRGAGDAPSHPPEEIDQLTTISRRFDFHDNFASFAGAP